MREPSDIAVSGREFYVCDFKVRNVTPSLTMSWPYVVGPQRGGIHGGGAVCQEDWLWEHHKLSQRDWYLRWATILLWGQPCHYCNISDAGDILIGDSHGNKFHVVVFSIDGTLLGEFECPHVKVHIYTVIISLHWQLFNQVSRCCGLKITSEGYVVTLAKNNHHVLVLNTLFIQ